MNENENTTDAKATRTHEACSVADIIDRLLAAVKADAPIPRAMVVLAAVEIERLRFAIARLADQDATLSVCDGRVTVTMDATLTDAERRAVERLCEATNESIADDKRADGCHWQDDAAAVAVVRGLLERLGDTPSKHATPGEGSEQS